MDDIDREIVAALQEDATISKAQLARRVNLSTTPCWRRVQKLKERGVIRKEVALLDRVHLNVGLTAFVFVRTNQHTHEWVERFTKAVEDIPEVVEFYRMSGDVDYLMRLVIPDVKAYDAVYSQLIQAVDIFDVTTSFAMEDLKYSTALPLDYI